eukprot:TRINITY_DN9083_c0_g1_i1.p1 TRINITY_DN9083_c0_g1~~TRINITY_DN9083_c0_g1_i1.p1  ORF type:complete len:294 (+),score=24.61 TRINITY_DN9083_c0_g1_i1:99-980(+)
MLLADLCMIIASHSVLAADRQRITDILCRLKDDVICLQGTRERNWNGEHRWSCRGYDVYSFPAGANKHTGLCICIKKTLQHVTRVWLPKAGQGQAELDGRLAGIRVKCANSDFAVFNAYLPNAAETRLYRRCLAQLDQWVDELPSRCVPVICTDSNAHLGYKTTNGMQHMTNSSAVGHKQPERQDMHGDLLAAFLEGQHMTAVNTHYACGGTYYAQSGRATRIDFICLPRSFIEADRVHWAKVYNKSGDYLQKIRARQRLDHRPVAVSCDLRLSYEGVKKQVKWYEPSMGYRP